MHLLERAHSSGAERSVHPGTHPGTGHAPGGDESGRVFGRFDIDFDTISDHTLDRLHYRRNILKKVDDGSHDIKARQ